MDKPTYHILVCNSFRASGDPQGVCHKKGSGLMQYIEEECIDRGLDAMITSTGCLKVCDRGPVMVIYPHNIWYAKVETEEMIDEILDALEDGEELEKYLID